MWMYYTDDCDFHPALMIFLVKCILVTCDLLHVLALPSDLTVISDTALSTMKLFSLSLIYSPKFSQVPVTIALLSVLLMNSSQSNIIL